MSGMDDHRQLMVILNPTVSSSWKEELHGIRTISKPRQITSLNLYLVHPSSRARRDPRPRLLLGPPRHPRLLNLTLRSTPLMSMVTLTETASRSNRMALAALLVCETENI